MLKEKWPKENQIETPLTFQLGESLLVQLSNIIKRKNLPVPTAVLYLFILKGG